MAGPRSLRLVKRVERNFQITPAIAFRLRQVAAVVCTENLIRIELVMESRHAGGDDRLDFLGPQRRITGKLFQGTGNICFNIREASQMLRV